MKQGTVEKIVNGGWGLVRSDEGVVFLNYVIPGEEVVYRIKDRARGVLWGELLQVLEPSPQRVAPPCPYFGQCGGCVFQHIDYPRQLKIKKQILQDDLERIGHYKTPLPDVVESPPYHNRVRARMKGQDDGKIGFIKKGTNQVLPIQQCLLFPDAVSRFLEQWNQQPDPPFFHQLDIFYNPQQKKIYVNLSHPPQEHQLKKLFPFTNVIFIWPGSVQSGVSPLTINDYLYYVGPDVFFQVNPFQWSNMLEAVDAFLEPAESMIDLYCGVGFFIPLLLHKAREIVGVESYGPSVALAQKAFPQVEFFKAPTEKFYFPEADTLVMDPPRSGLSKHVMKRICNGGYRKLIYVSCSSATFGRDLAVLTQNGFKAAHLKVFDLFPQTPHLETISLLVRD